MLNRRIFNKLAGLSMIGISSIGAVSNLFTSEKSGIKMPVIFAGHGSPMNAVEDNEFTKKWYEIGNSIPKPKAILSVSAHWLTNGTYATFAEKPKTIYDFYGFPEILFQQKYDAPGSIELATSLQNQITSPKILKDLDWGLDHGTWSVLIKMFPQADIPVVQLSISGKESEQFHFDLGKKLQFLRERGVLIFCSGNIVHNLRRIKWEGGTYDWAVEFDEKVKSLIDKRDFNSLINWQSLGSSTELSIPTNDHYLPLMYALGASDKDSKIDYFAEKVIMGSLSMRGLVIN